MPRKRSLDGAASVLSSASTDDSSFSSTRPYVELNATSATTSLSASAGSTTPTIATNVQEGWMYWKRDHECWMKVYVLLRRQFLWLIRSTSHSSLASPLIQIAVADVEQISARGFRVTGPSHETMELYLYGEGQAEGWLIALQTAASATQTELKHLEQARRPPHPLRRIFSRRRPTTCTARALRGTLVVYHEECKVGRWTRFWNSLRFRQSCRKLLEDAMDRVDESSSVGPRR